MVRESQKQARNKWDAENMKVLGCKMRRDRAEAFQALCKIKGTTPNAVFQAAAEAFLAEHGGRIGDSCGSSQDGAQGGEAQGQEGKKNGNT